MPVIGVPLILAGPNEVIMQAFKKGLRERGYVDGENIRIEHRSAGGKMDKLRDVVRELSQSGIDIFVAGAEAIALAIKEISPSTPTVLLAFDTDPVASGLVKSLSRPGGNITGVSTMLEETSGKRVELLRDLLPAVKRIGVLYDDYGQRQLEAFRAGARVLNLDLRPLRMESATAYDEAFQRARKDRIEAVVVAFSPRFFVERQSLVDSALKHRLPTVFYEQRSVNAGGLLSYGPDATQTWIRAAYFIDLILKGQKPSDLPVEQPNTYKLAVNLKTARALGLSVPEVVMVRADEVVR